MIKFCKNCFEHPESEKIKDNGYWPFLYDDDYKCPSCGGHLDDVDISAEDYLTIVKISGDISFIQSMIKLKQSDPIEYQLKMSQFRTQLGIQEQQKIAKQQHESDNKIQQIHCPKCGSSNVTEGTRGFTLTTGFLGSGNFRYVCKKCGNKWKPGGWKEALQNDLSVK